jgi:ATP-dependent Lhr-like helicase
LPIDGAKNTCTTRAGIEFVLYQSGGTIPDRGYYHLRLADSKAVIGELDEEFVWERRLGDQFSLGTQTWRIVAITHNDVEVGHRVCVLVLSDQLGNSCMGKYPR